MNFVKMNLNIIKNNFKYEELISELKFFNEKHSNVRIICAGSLLGVKLSRLNRPFPVGKVSRIDMYPIDFEEFLMTFNQDALLDRIKECFDKNETMGLIHDKVLSYYKEYLFSGGMPDSVSELLYDLTFFKWYEQSC